MRKNFFVCLSLSVVFLLSTFCFDAFSPGTVAAARRSAVKKHVPASADPAVTPASAAPPATNSSDPALQIDARGAMLVEVSTGTVLFEQNADEPIEPASFTKVLTLYLLFEALEKGVAHLDDQVYVSKQAWQTGGSKMFVDVESRVVLEELIKGIAVVSGNDACIAVAEHLFGGQDAFVSAMNSKAREIGMAGSTFMNPHGLPADGQITTARDMATLGMTYLQRFPESLRFHSMREFTYNDILQYNRNHLLLKDDTVDGLKTGYVAASGYHLAATAQREGMRLLAVVMGAVSPGVREREALKLLNYGFRQFALVEPFPANQPISSVKLWKGEKDVLDLYSANRVNLLVPRSQKDAIKWEVHAPTEAVAPISTGQELGDVVMYLDGEARKTVPLVSREDVPLAGFFKRTWHTVRQVHNFNWRWIGTVAGGSVLVVAFLAFIITRRPFRRRSRSSRF